MKALSPVTTVFAASCHTAVTRAVWSWDKEQVDHIRGKMKIFVWIYIEHISFQLSMHFRFIRCKSWIISFESHIKLTVHPYVINNGLMSSTNAFRKSSCRARKNLHLCHLFFRIFIFDTILHSDIRCNTDMKKILRQWLCTIPATGGWSCAHNYIVNIAHIRAHNPCHRCAVCGCLLIYSSKL